jgi:hypothetical protein
MKRQLTYIIFALLLGGISDGAAQDEKPVLFTDASPVELYRTVHRAKWKVDVDTVLACTSRRVDATPETVYKQLMQDRSVLPQSIDDIEEKIVGKIATLVMTGRRSDRETDKVITSRGTITLVKEDGTWRIRHEAWQDVETSE